MPKEQLYNPGCKTRPGVCEWFWKAGFANHKKVDHDYAKDRNIRREKQCVRRLEMGKLQDHRRIEWAVMEQDRCIDPQLLR